jgi:hypothetical protein
MPATNWAVHATVNDYTVWFKDGIYNITDGSLPSDGMGGYPNLNSVLGLKNLVVGDLRPCSPQDREIRAEPADSFGGRKSWHGSYLLDGDWRLVDDGYGPRFYHSPDAARKAAAMALDNAIEARVGRGTRPDVDTGPTRLYC